MLKKVERKVFDFIDRYKLIEEGDNVLVAVSGGPDSVFLLHLFFLLQRKFGVEFTGCHINHHLRGVDSNGDEKFVVNMCKKMNVPLIVKDVDVSLFMKRKKVSLEEAARELRLKVLEEEASKLKAQKIAIGHTSDDNVETFFLNLLRGSGKTGILGIGKKRGRIIRPLLCLTKQEIVIYLKVKRLNYRIDASNWDIQYRRNFVRRELVPMIEKHLNKQVKKNILNLIEIISDEEEIVLDAVESEKLITNSESPDGILIDRIAFRKCKAAIQRRIIINVFQDVSGDYLHLNFRAIESLRKAINGVASGLKFCFFKTNFFLSVNSVLVSQKEVFEPEKHVDVELNIPLKTRFRNRWIIETSILESVDGDIKEVNCAYFDLDEVHPPIVLRTKCNGDKFVPFGMKQEKKIKDYFIDSKIPFWQRMEIPIVVDRSGILWITGLRRSNRARIKESTKRILKIVKREIV